MRFQGKGKPRETWEESRGGLWERSGGLWRRGVGVGGQGSMLKLVGGVVPEHRLLMGVRAIRKGDSWFLVAEKKKDSVSVPCSTKAAEAHVWPSSLYSPGCVPLLQTPGM